MTCPSCGAQIADTTKFCGKCGASIAGAPAAVKEWFIYVNNENKGPYGIGEVRKFFAEGGITGATHVWKEGMDGWVQAGKIAELTAAPVAQGGGAAGEITPEQREELKRKGRELKQKEKQKLAEEKKRLKSKKTKSAFTRAMGYQPTQTARWFESPIVVIIFLILLPPLGLVLMLKSRLFPTAFKFLIFIVITFVVLFFWQVFSEVAKYNVAGLSRDPNSLPSGFSRASFDAIEIGMKREYVYYIFGDDPECADENQKGGVLSKCKWKAYDKNNNMNFIHVDFQQDVVMEKCWEEKLYQKECKSLSESAKKILRLVYKR